MYSSPMGPSFAVCIILYYTLKAYDYIGAHSIEKFLYFILGFVMCITAKSD